MQQGRVSPYETAPVRLFKLVKDPGATPHNRVTSGVPHEKLVSSAFSLLIKSSVGTKFNERGIQMADFSPLLQPITCVEIKEYSHGNNTTQNTND